MNELKYQSLSCHEKPDMSLCLNSDQLKTFGMDLERHSYHVGAVTLSKAFSLKAEITYAHQALRLAEMRASCIV